MKDLGFFGRIFIATKPVDFRKQAHGLALIVDGALGLNSLAEKNLVVFTNKRRNAVKALYFDSTGYALWWKSLEKSRFPWPKSKAEAMQIQVRDLKWLLEGVDFTRIKRHEKLKIRSR